MSSVSPGWLAVLCVRCYHGHRAVSNWVSKVIHDCFAFAQFRTVMGPKKSRHLLIQSDSKLICLFLTWIPTGWLWCRPALQLAFVSTVVLVFRNWTENCSIIKMNLNFDDFVGFKVWNSLRREKETEFLQGDIGKYSICHYNGGLLLCCPLLSRKSADECQYRSNCASTLLLTQNLPLFLSVDYCCYWSLTEFCW